MYIDWKSYQTTRLKLVYLLKLRSFIVLGNSIPGRYNRFVHMTSSPHVYWLTGLSDSGKSTMCRKLVSYLRECGRQVILLDGDEIRAVVGAVKAHTREDRLALALRYSRLCKLLADQGFDVAIATISLFEEVHVWNREHLPGYCEIFLDVPLDELRRRDTKGIYQRYDNNEINNVAGVDLQVDFPKSPDILLRFAPNLDQDAMFSELFRQLKELGKI